MQVNVPRLNTSQVLRLVLSLSTPERWKAELVDFFYRHCFFREIMNVITIIEWLSICVFIAVIVSFPLLEMPDVIMLAWTTTPWTLPSNVALCVHPDLIYVKIKGQQHSDILLLNCSVAVIIGRIIGFAPAFVCQSVLY